MNCSQDTSKIDSMRYAGKVNLEAIERGFKYAQPGMVLSDVDDIIERHIRSRDCTPAFKHYQPEGAPSPFPATACISPNDVVVHGVPGSYVLQDGDLLTIDVGTEYNGWFVDAARSRVIGENKEAQYLVDVTEAVMSAQLGVIKNNCTFMQLIEAAESVATEFGVLIMPQWGGHSIGNAIHLPPFIPNAIDRTQSSLRQQVEENRYSREKLVTGQTICVEPVVTYENIRIMLDEDGWTVRKPGGELAAHTERCLLVTEDGYELLS